MRVIDCDCGQTLQAGNEEDLVNAVRAHVDADHPDMEMTDDQVRDFVSSRSYEASDS
jgi:predicted small metal-binding protein